MTAKPASAAPGQTRPPRSAAVQIIRGIGALALLILVQSSWQWALLHATGRDYLIVMIIAAVVVFAFVRVRNGLGLSAPPLFTLAVWFVVATGGVGGVLLFANAYLDPGPAREITTLAAGEHCGGRSSDISVRGAPGAPALPEGGTMRVGVGNRTCRAMRDGDTVLIVIRPGYFGRPWVQKARPIPGARQ